MPTEALPDDVDGLWAMMHRLTGEREASLTKPRRLSQENDQFRHLWPQLQRRIT